jgi:hypothetical protein
MPVQIEVDPFFIAAAFRTPQKTSVKTASFLNIVYRKRKMKRRDVGCHRSGLLRLEL